MIYENVIRENGTYWNVEDFLGEVLQGCMSDEDILPKEENQRETAIKNICNAVHRFHCACLKGVKCAKIYAHIKVPETKDGFIYRADNIDIYVKLDEKSNITTFIKWELTSYIYKDERVLQ